MKAPTAIIEAPTANVIEAPTEGTAAPAVSIIMNEPEPPARVTLVREVIPEVSTCVMFNGKTFSRPCQANLRGNNPRLAPSALVMLTFEQDCFRGQLSMSWVGTHALDQPKTKPSEKVNPRGTHGHTLKIDISSLDIEDFTIIDASKYKGTPPEVFGCQTTDPNTTNYFDVTDKAYICKDQRKVVRRLLSI
jgi:hypothetical protein